MDLLSEALIEYVSLTDLTVDEQGQFLWAQHCDDVVEEAAKQSATLADAFFIAAVASAGTHTHIVGDVVLDSVPANFVKSIGAILRYAKAICDASGLEVQGWAPMAFVFGQVRRMCAAGFKNLELFLSLADRFEELITRLRRIDGYLEVPPKGDADTTILTSALVDIIRLCGQVTKFMEGIFCGDSD